MYTYPTAPVNATLPQWLDTWYLKAGDRFGQMRLGLGPRTAVTGADAFLEQHVRAVVDAIPVIGSLAAIQLTYVTIAQPRHMRTHSFSGGDTLRNWLAFAAALHHMTEIVSGTYIQMSLQVAVHNEQREVQRAVMPAVISLTPDIRGLAHYAEAPEKLREWQAQFDCDAASAFRRDNSAKLLAVRNLWHHERTQVGSMDETNIGDEEYHNIVTLANAPAAAPATNEELYRLNYPRLKQMITQWEQAARCTFESAELSKRA